MIRAGNLGLLVGYFTHVAVNSSIGIMQVEDVVGIPTGDLVSLGVGGVLAFIVLLWKRADDKERRETTDRFASTIESMNGQYLEAMRSNIQVISTMTQAVTEVQKAIEELKQIVENEERLDRVEHQIRQLKRGELHG
ncbi:MAG: hypothetical protein OEX12_11660 [Gammaproteobacteria bacterium]|nr:hypothetical protein [Gammaproteobacteria bacterium]